MTNDATQTRKTRYIWFPLLVILTGTGILTTLAFLPNSREDSSKYNLLGMITFSIVASLLLVWTLRYSGIKRLYVLLGTLLIVGTFLASFQIVSMDGRFLPIFGPRPWLARILGSDQTELVNAHHAQIGKYTGPVNLTPQPNDWPGFRGGDRLATVPNAKIQSNWETNPPKLVWSQPCGGGYSSFAIANGFLVTLEQLGDQEALVCYEAATGKIAWKHSWKAAFRESTGGDGPRSTPTIHEGHVYALGATGHFVCVDGATGQEKWSKELLEGNSNVQWAMSGSPLVVDDLVIINPGAQKESSKGKALRAYHRLTGELVWQSGNYRTGYCSPQLATISGVRQILIFDGHGFAGYALENGAELWRKPWRTNYDINVAQPIPLGDDCFFISSGYGTGSAVVQISKKNEQWTHRELWRENRVLLSKFSSPVRRGDYIYGLSDGWMECVNVQTGESEWKDKREQNKGAAYGHGQVLLCGDRILVLSEFGELILLEATPDKLTELGRIDALTEGPKPTGKGGVKSWNYPAFADGKIYVRNEAQMACYDLR
jgi:outer membrane protein assembly factor BamB